MAYQKYLSIPNRRGNVGDRDHFQHIENALQGVVPGPGEVIVGSADGPVAQPALTRDDIPGLGHVRLMTLMSGAPGESYIPVSCTVAPDTEHARVGDRGLKATTTTATPAAVYYDPPTPITMPPAQAVIMWVYIPNPELVTSVGVWLHLKPETNRWYRTVTDTAFKTGWNLIRISAHVSTIHGWDEISRVRFTFETTAATTVTLGQIALESRPKASILMINDGAYRTFVERGLPDLRARGIPVTWSLDPMRMGANPNTPNERITEAEMAAIARANPQDSVGLHGYTGGPTETMTPDEIITDTVEAQKWLSSRGYTGGFWRSAWVQNRAENYAAASPYLVAGATPTGSHNPTPWPATDRYRLGRMSIHGTTDLDERFEFLRKTHSLQLMYTHGITEEGPFDTSPARWATLLENIDRGLREDWLEAVTMETLLARAGAQWRSGFGETVLEYYDETGVLRQYRPV